MRGNSEGLTTFYRVTFCMISQGAFSSAWISLLLLLSCQESVDLVDVSSLVLLVHEPCSLDRGLIIIEVKGTHGYLRCEGAILKRQ